MRIGLFAVVAFCLVACGSTSSPRIHVQQISPPPRSVQPTAIVHTKPVRLQIQKLSLDIQIEEVGTDSSGVMETPSDYTHVGWYSPGIIPGNPGDSVIDGHLDWVVNDQNVPGPFANLATMEKDDTFQIVTQNGEILRFSVTEKKSIAYDADPSQFGLFQDGPPRVTLITCSGEWDQGSQMYQQRLIITGFLVT